MSGNNTIDGEDPNLHYVECAEDAAAMVRWVGEGGPRVMAVDTETTGLERDARVRLIQFGDRMDAWTIRADRWAGAAHEALDRMKRDRRYRIVFHNAPFDVPKLERLLGHKFDWGMIDDTMIMSRLANPLTGHSLKSLATRFVHPKAAVMQSILSDAMLANGWNWATVPYDYVGYSLYAGVDCVLTARLLEKLEKLKFKRELYETEISVMEACVSMSEIGMSVDLRYCREQIELLEREIADVTRQAREEFGVTALGSDQIMIDKLHSLGFTWDERTPKGKIALDADVLVKLAALAVDKSKTALDDDYVSRLGKIDDRQRLPYLILQYRTRVKLLNTYFRNFVINSEADGRVHPEINSLEAVTGRMTGNMQQLPRGPRARRAFEAGTNEYFLLADYAQIEVRLLAHFCGDPSLIEAINSGDVHHAVGSMIFGEENVTALVRQLAKTSQFAVIYGAGPEQFAHTAGVNIEQASAFLDAYYSKFPGVKRFIYEVQDKARGRMKSEGSAYVTTPAGRRLQMRKSEAYYTLVNYLIQGSAADVLKQAIVKLWNAGLGDYMRLPVHDEMIFEIPLEHDPEEMKREIDKLMFDGDWRVPLIAEAAGPYHSWADKYSPIMPT